MTQDEIQSRLKEIDSLFTEYTQKRDELLYEQYRLQGEYRLLQKLVTKEESDNAVS